jgi:hypothetical protein
MSRGTDRRESACERSEDKLEKAGAPWVDTGLSSDRTPKYLILDIWHRKN